MEAAKKHILALSPAHRMHARIPVLMRPETNHKANSNEMRKKVGNLPRQERHGEAV